MPLFLTPPPYVQHMKRIQADPENADLWEELGDLLAEQGDNTRAEKCYQQVLTLRPDDIEARMSLERLQGKPLSPETSTGAFEDFLSELENWRQHAIPLWFQVFLAVFSFLATLLVAVAQQWEVTDLVWSLWISSLVLGYAYLLTGILSRALRGVEGWGEPWSRAAERVSPARETGWVVVGMGAAFMIAFFSVHFIFFHYGHSVFLNQFFPLMSKGTAFLPFPRVVSMCMLRYWPVVLLSAATQLPQFLKVAEGSGTDFIVMPYRNVIKMHLSIFVFAGLSMVNISSLALYYLLILYYFPFGALLTFFKSRKEVAV